MAVVSQFVFFDTTSSEQFSNVFGNAQQGNALTLQIDDFGAGFDNLNIEVEGGADMNQPESFYKIKVVSLDSFKTTTQISKAGLYLCIISGVSNIRLKCNNESMLGSFKAFAVSVS